MDKCKIGLDRVLLKGLNILQIDTKLLKARGFTVIQDNSKCIRVMRDTEGKETYINYIKVSKRQDETLLINELRVGQKEIDTNIFSNKVDYEHLDITLPKSLSETRTNENNVSNTVELLESLKLIQDELEGLGFGKVNLLEAEIKEMEINQNIELERPFKEYERVLEYMQGLLPNRLKSDLNSNYKAGNQYSGFKAGNKTMNIKMYDKKANVLRKSKKDIGKERLRIEYSFLNEQKIKDVFGDNRLGYIVKDDFNLIVKAFKQMLQDDLVDRLYKDIDKQLKQATRELVRYKSEKTKLSGMEYIFDHNVFDIEIILGALKKNTPKGNYARECKNLIDRSLEGKQKYLFGNIDKLNEILGEMGQAKIDIEMTKHIEKTVAKYY